MREIVVGARSGFAGQLYLGCVPSSLFGALPAILGPGHGGLGAFEIRIVEGHTAEVVAGVLDGRLDAALAWEDSPTRPLAFRPLEFVRFIAALHPSHPLVAKKRVALRDFVDEPLIVSPRDVTPRQFDRIMDGFRQAGLSPRIGQHARSIAAQLGFVASGLGYALVPAYARNLALAGVEFRPLAEVLESSPLSLLWNEARPSPQLAALRQRVEEAFPPPRARSNARSRGGRRGA
jgi:DNA-binding transcriptional LysR family regulator